MNFKHDLAELCKKELILKGIEVPPEWNDHEICIMFLEISDRCFNSNVSYEVKYSKELLEKLPTLTEEEQSAIKDIETCLKTCKSITSYMSKDILKTSVKKSDFLLKNWNIYHLHLEKREEKGFYQNPNLLFFQPQNQVVYFIDIKKHPTGETWFDRDLLNIIFNNWPELLIYREGFKVKHPIPDNKVHGALKQSVAAIDFHEGCLFPTNLGVSTSGNSNMIVGKVNRLFNEFMKYEKMLLENEKTIKHFILGQQTSMPNRLDYRLEIENDFFVAREIKTGLKIKMFRF